MIIMDFSKEFDTTPHNRLLNKLNRYGNRNKTHTSISNFLKYRKQRVVTDGEHFTWTEVMSGVPQCTLLCPLLFLTYINDLPNNIHSLIRLFADDCVLYREIKNEIDSQELQRDLKFTDEMGVRLADAFQSSKMICNSTNTRYTITWEGLAADRTKWRSALKQHLNTGDDKLMAAAADKRARRKEGSSSIRPETINRCDVCNKDCHSHIGLFSHKRRCYNPARN